jgi:hypothetical protein
MTDIAQPLAMDVAEAAGAAQEAPLCRRAPPALIYGRPAIVIALACWRSSIGSHRGSTATAPSSCRRIVIEVEFDRSAIRLGEDPTTCRQFPTPTGEDVVRDGAAADVPRPARAERAAPAILTNNTQYILRDRSSAIRA